MFYISAGVLLCVCMKHTQANNLCEKVRYLSKTLLFKYSNDDGNVGVYPPLCILCEVGVHKPSYHHIPHGGEGQDSDY